LVQTYLDTTLRNKNKEIGVILPKATLDFNPTWKKHHGGHLLTPMDFLFLQKYLSFRFSSFLQSALMIQLRWKFHWVKTVAIVVALYVTFYCYLGIIDLNIFQIWGQWTIMIKRRLINIALPLNFLKLKIFRSIWDLMRRYVC
jgi:hypothetical protein